MYLDKQEIGFELKSDYALWTSQSKTDKVSYLVAPPSHIQGIVPFIFDHPNIVPIPIKMQILENPSITLPIMINGSKQVKKIKDRTQLYIQRVQNVHFRVFFRWLHLQDNIDLQTLRKTQEQTWKSLERLINESKLSLNNRSTIIRCGGKFAQCFYDVLPISDKNETDFNLMEAMPFYRRKDGTFYYDIMEFLNGSWSITEKKLEKYISIIKEDKC